MSQTDESNVEAVDAVVIGAGVVGLAVTGLISAGAQVLILIGAWLMWRSWRQR